MRRKGDLSMLDIRSFGAVGDGLTDDTAAVQAAIDKAAETGETVYVGPGVYSWPLSAFTFGTSAPFMSIRTLFWMPVFKRPSTFT